MGGILDAGYGVAEARREKWILRSIAAAVAVALLGTVLYFTFRTWSEEKSMDRFLAHLKQGQYSDAYQMWDCKEGTPCKFYPPNKFAEDFGPASPYSTANQFKINEVDYCDSGVVFNLTYPGKDDVNLWIDGNSKLVSFAPWPRCPRRHWEFKAFFKRVFASGS